MKTILALALLVMSASAQTFTCSGCSDYGPIGTTGYTMQYGAKMVWTASVDPGAYLVDLTFVEPLYTTGNQRPLNVTVNGVSILSAFDVVAAGGALTPVKWSTIAAPGAGKIVVVLTANSTVVAGKVTPHSAILTAISASKLNAGTAPALNTFFVVGVPLTMPSDGNAVLNAIGYVVSGSVQVHRNGLLQSNADVVVDTNDPSKIKVSLTNLTTYDPTDTWAVSYQRR